MSGKSGNGSSDSDNLFESDSFSQLEGDLSDLLPTKHRARNADMVSGGFVSPGVFRTGDHPVVGDQPKGRGLQQVPKRYYPTGQHPNVAAKAAESLDPTVRQVDEGPLGAPPDDSGEYPPIQQRPNEAYPQAPNPAGTFQRPGAPAYSGGQIPGFQPASGSHPQVPPQASGNYPQTPPQISGNYPQAPPQPSGNYSAAPPPIEAPSHTAGAARLTHQTREPSGAFAEVPDNLDNLLPDQFRGRANSGGYAVAREASGDFPAVDDSLGRNIPGSGSHAVAAVAVVTGQHMAVSRPTSRSKVVDTDDVSIFWWSALALIMIAAVIGIQVFSASYRTASFPEIAPLLGFGLGVPLLGGLLGQVLRRKSRSSLGFMTGLGLAALVMAGLQVPKILALTEPDARVEHGVSHSKIPASIADNELVPLLFNGVSMDPATRAVAFDIATDASEPTLYGFRGGESVTASLTAYYCGAEDLPTALREASYSVRFDVTSNAAGELFRSLVMTPADCTTP